MAVISKLSYDVIATPLVVVILFYFNYTAPNPFNSFLVKSLINERLRAIQYWPADKDPPTLEQVI